MAKTTYEIVIIGLLAALAAVLQIYNGVIGIPVPFGMTVDLAAVPVLLALFLFGFESAAYVLILLTLIITLTAPTGWIGASMKLTATIPMIAVPALYLIAAGKRQRFAALALCALVLVALASLFAGQAALALHPPTYGPQKPMGQFDALVGLAPVAALVLALYALVLLWRPRAARISLATLHDPLTAVALLVVAVVVRGIATTISNYFFAVPLFLGMTSEQAMAAFPPAFMFGFNALQGAVEFGIAWLVAYRFGLAARYGREGRLQ